jgi:MscS family membrane protein
MWIDSWLSRVSQVAPLLGTWWFHPLLTFVVFVSVATLIERLGERLLRRWLGTAEGDPGQIVLDRLVRPVTALIALAGVHYATLVSDLPVAVLDPVTSGIATVAVLLGVTAVHNAVHEAMDHKAEQRDTNSWIQPHTVPLYDMGLKIVLATLGINLVFLAWSVDLTAWIAHAGILGVVVGFAAQETLGNLFAGVTVFVDQPYRVGDFLVLEDRTRGRVVDIGLRSTRIVTADATEVIVPNKQMANGRVTNVSTGLLPLERYRVAVQVAYGTDLAHATALILQMALELSPHTEPEAAPTVRFVSFDDNGIRLELGVHAAPEDREAMIDAMIRGIERVLREGGVVIPFPQLDVHRG